MTMPAAEQTPTQVVLAALQSAGCDIKRISGQWAAQCPSHDDRMPSLTIKEGKDGQALVHCHAGCHTGDVIDAVGLRMTDLFPDSDRATVAAAPWKAYLQALKQLDAPKQAGEAKARPLPEQWERVKVDHYDYTDADGAPFARVVRFDLIDKESGEVVGKTFVQQRWTGATYAGGMQGAKLPLYRLPRVREAVAAGMPVLVVEGEKDVHTAEAAGLVATTNAGGAGGWLPQHTEALAGANVIIVVDQDNAGRTHAAQVNDALTQAGCRVRLVRPAEGKDFSDHVAAGHGLAELVPLDVIEHDVDEVDIVAERFPVIDWHELWADETEEEWIIAPLLPKRRLIALYSPPKVGKSLLLLEIAAAIATGKAMFGYEDPPEPQVVLYVDFENDPRGDVRTRLRAMGYGPDDLGNLRYLSFPTMSHLDGEQGSLELMANVAYHKATVVVIDTVSRAVKGEENENDTWLAFYRHTGLKMKQAGVSLIRLDHTGKDVTKGQRGGSAKSGDVDAVWRLSKVSEDTFQLECEAKRFQIAETRLDLVRETTPWLRHVLSPHAVSDMRKAAVAAAVVDLDAHLIDPSTGYKKAHAALQALGKEHSLRVVQDAQERRRRGTQTDLRGAE